MSSSTGLEPKPSSAIAFLPIKPEYAHRIVAGEKRFEFRKASFASQLSHIVIYASTPIKKIIGIAAVTSIDISSPTATWENTKHAAGISRSAFRAYFYGKKLAYAIVIDKVHVLDRWVSPDEIVEGFKIPQSFVYVKAPFLKRVMKKGAAR